MLEFILALCSGSCSKIHNCQYVSRQIMPYTNAAMHFGAEGRDDSHFSTLKWSTLQFPQLSSYLHTNNAQIPIMHNANALMHSGYAGWYDSYLAFYSGACFNFRNCHHVIIPIMHNINDKIHFGAVRWDDSPFNTL